MDAGTIGFSGGLAIASSIACAASSHAAYVASGSDSRVRITLSWAPPRNRIGTRRVALRSREMDAYVPSVRWQPRQVDHESLRKVLGKSAQYAGGDRLVRYVIPCPRLAALSGVALLPASSGPSECGA